jgi:rod shape-determining protein MreD
MSNRRNARHLPVLLAIVVSMMLAIAPLPEAVRPFQPDWVALTLIYWCMVLPHNYSVGTAWLVGAVLDVAQGTLLGQHALALSATVYLTARFHLQLRVFPLSQLTLTVFALLAVYQFILFWVNGVAGVSAPAVNFWGPLLTGTLLWPLVYFLLGTLNYRRRRS